MLQTGETPSLMAICKRLGVGYTTVRARLARGVPMEQALILPKAKLHTHKGQSLTVTEWAKRSGIPRETLFSRLSRMSIKDALTRRHVPKFRYEFTGQRFGRLVCLKRVRVGPKNCYKCQCDCGATVIIRAHALANGQDRCKSDECRALPRDGSARPRPFQRAKDMGLKNEYRIWVMRRRQGLLPLEWQDFWEFIEDVGARPKGHWRLMKEDKNGPFDATNVGWIRVVGTRRKRVV